MLYDVIEKAIQNMINEFKKNVKNQTEDAI